MIARRALLAGLTGLAALAVPAAARAAALPAPAEPIVRLNAALLAAMHAGATTPFAARAATLRPVVEQVFDLPTILRNSVGPRWPDFAPASQAELLDAFTAFTVASWTANFDTFNGERFEVLPALREVGADEVVESRIIPASGDPTRLDYVMRSGTGGWRAVDVLVDGSISRVAIQRSDFRSLLASGDPAPLLAMLRRKASAMATGSAS
jgi:phospholipid transport system substrate-binding protein